MQTAQSKETILLITVKQNNDSWLMAVPLHCLKVTRALPKKISSVLVIAAVGLDRPVLRGMQKCNPSPTAVNEDKAPSRSPWCFLQAGCWHDSQLVQRLQGLARSKLQFSAVTLLVGQLLFSITVQTWRTYRWNAVSLYGFHGGSSPYQGAERLHFTWMCVK